MIYRARTQRGLLGIFLILTLSSTIKMKDVYTALFYFQILLILFLFVGIFTIFKLKIDDGYLTYQILVLSMPIYRKVIYPNQIDEIKFKRIALATNGAILHMKKGLNIRIVHFDPNNIFVDLVDFANKHGVSISKTDDYLMLEK